MTAWALLAWAGCGALRAPPEPLWPAPPEPALVEASWADGRLAVALRLVPPGGRAAEAALVGTAWAGASRLGELPPLTVEVPAEGAVVTWGPVALPETPGEVAVRGTVRWTPGGRAVFFTGEVPVAAAGE